MFEYQLILILKQAKNSLKQIMKRGKEKMKKASKKDIFDQYGIRYENGKIYNPLFGFVPMMLINGNAKLGKGVWTFSTLAGTAYYDAIVNGIKLTVKGTCLCNCCGCYAQSGFYKMQSTINALAMRTQIARCNLDWLKNAIVAQIKAEKIKLVRIHASGDFFSNAYVNMWIEIASECKDTAFWTYTKNRDAENAFNGISNVNVVKSIIDGCGFNFGHCDYVMETFHKLENMGKSVHICRCGIDNNQHCNNCKGCSKNEYVLFIEHSTSYKATEDASFPKIVKLIENQKAM